MRSGWHEEWDAVLAAGSHRCRFPPIISRPLPPYGMQMILGYRPCPLCGETYFAQLARIALSPLANLRAAAKLYRQGPRW